MTGFGECNPGAASAPNSEGNLQDEISAGARLGAALAPALLLLSLPPLHADLPTGRGVIVGIVDNGAGI